jgi:hypothetical protein
LKEPIVASLGLLLPNSAFRNSSTVIARVKMVTVQRKMASASAGELAGGMTAALA